jgi:hypothetical protein
MKKDERINGIIKRFTTDDIEFFDKNDLMYLYNSNLIKEIRYVSNLVYSEKRMDFINDEFRNGMNKEWGCNQFTKFVLLLKSSSSFPILCAEVAELNTLCFLLPKNCQIIWGIGTDESLHKGLSIDIIASR